MVLNLTNLTLRERLFLTGLAALLISAVTSSFAGIYLSESSELLELIPGLMVLVPPLLNMRGSISGVLASRLSSSMHLGAFEISFRNGAVLGDNLRASFAITILITFVVGVLAYAVCAISGHAVTGLRDLVVISVTSGIISGLLLMLITVVITVASYRHQLDLDMIASPTITTAGDVITLPVLVCSAAGVVALPESIRTILFISVMLIVAGAFVYSIYGNRNVWCIVREAVPLLIPLSFLGVLAGLVYTADLDSLIGFAVFLILIPPFAGGCGSIGGILASKLATEMHTGAINPSLLPGREVIPHFLHTYLYTLILLPLIAVISHGAGLVLGMNSPGPGVVVFITLVTGMILMTLVNGVAYAAASMSFRYGFDPDNFGIPVITSLIDLLGAVALTSVINIMI